MSNFLYNIAFFHWYFTRVIASCLFFSYAIELMVIFKVFGGLLRLFSLSYLKRRHPHDKDREK